MSLGENNFLLTYGTGLIQFGYENSPLEQIASSLQEEFECGTLGPELVEVIQKRTGAVWNKVVPLFKMLE